MRSYWLLSIFLFGFLIQDAECKFILLKIAYLILKTAFKLFIIFIGRRKRSLGYTDEQREKFFSYLQIAQKLDEDNCIPRTICEIMATGPQKHFGEFENSIYRFYSGNFTKEGFQPSRSNAAFTYSLAALYGKIMRKTDECAKLYSMCHETPTSLHHIIDESSHQNNLCF